MIYYLNRRIVGVRLELEASRDYQTDEQNSCFLLPNPWQTLEAIKVA